MKHVDEWLDSPSNSNARGVNYAKFVINHMRMPAWCQFAFKEWTSPFKLFCSYKNKVYRVTGASRMGDIWLKELPVDFKDDELEVHGYDLRVDVEECSNWGSDRHSILTDIPVESDEIRRAKELLQNSGYYVIEATYYKPLTSNVSF